MTDTFIVFWDGNAPRVLDGEAEAVTYADLEVFHLLFDDLPISWPKPTDKPIAEGIWRRLVHSILEALGGLVVVGMPTRLYWFPNHIDDKPLDGELELLSRKLGEWGICLCAVESDRMVGSFSTIFNTVLTRLQNVVTFIESALEDTGTRRPSLFVRRLGTCDVAQKLVDHLSQEMPSLSFLPEYERKLLQLHDALTKGLLGAIEQVNATNRRYRHKEMEVPTHLISNGEETPDICADILVFGEICFHLVDQAAGVYHAPDGITVVGELAKVGMANRKLSINDTDITFISNGGPGASIQIHSPITAAVIEDLRSFGITYKESSSAKSTSD